MADTAGSASEFPRHLDAERAVLGAVLLDNDSLGRVSGVLIETDFYRPVHQRIYRAMVELFEAGEAIDSVTLSNAMDEATLDQIGGPGYFGELAMAIPATVTVQHYIDIVKDKATLRDLIASCAEIVEAAREQPRDIRPILDMAESRIFALSQFRDAKDVVPLRQVLEATYKSIEERAARQDDIIGCPTGFADLDRMTAGLQPGELIILAARPSMGKTALALNMVLNAAVQYQRPTAFFSLEMNKESLGMRLYSAYAEVKADHIRKGKLTTGDWDSLVQANEELAGTQIFLDDTPGLTLPELRSKARRLKKEHAVELIALDYLQLMGTDPRIDSREQQISSIARGLKGLAMEIKVPMLILSQLNRSAETRKDKHPMLSDLRESGAIEQDADVVMFIHRDDYYEKENSERPNMADLEIAKQRNGPTGRIELFFRKEIGRFENYAGDLE